MPAEQIVTAGDHRWPCTSLPLANPADRDLHGARTPRRSLSGCATPGDCSVFWRWWFDRIRRFRELGVRWVALCLFGLLVSTVFYGTVLILLVQLPISRVCSWWKTKRRWALPQFYGKSIRA